MTLSILYFIFYLLFSWLAWRRLPWAVLFVIATLPSYLVRFQVGPVPTTLLEGMVIIVVLVWAIKKLLIRRTHNPSSPPLNLRGGMPRTELVLVRGWVGLQFSIPITLFLVASTISMFTAPDLRAAAGAWKAYFIEPVLFFLVLRDLLSHNVILNGAKRSEESLANASRSDIRQRSFAALRMTPEKVVTALSLTALLLSAYAIYQRFTGLGIPPPWDAELRVTSIFPYPNALALFLAPLVPLFVAQVIAAWRRGSPPPFLPPRGGGLRWGGYWFLVTTLSITAIIFAKSTGAMVGVIAGILFMYALWPVRGKAHDRELFHARVCYVLRVTCYVMVAAVLAAAAIIALPSLKDELLLRNWPGHVRRTQWAETIEMLKDRPILGAGLAGYKETLAPYHKATYIEIFEYPHNIVLNFWSETGLLGLIAFVWLVVILFRKTLHSVHNPLQLPRAFWGRDRAAPPLKSDVSVGLRTVASESDVSVGLRTVASEIRGGRGSYEPMAIAAMVSMVVMLVHGLVDVPYFKNDLAMLFWIVYAIGVSSAGWSGRVVEGAALEKR